MDDLRWFAMTLWLFLPAYFANAAPVVLGGGGPLDGGARWLDGKPLLGGHKTVKGTFFGVVVGSFVGLLQGNSLGGFLQSVGAIGGDIVFSFVKRRLDLRPGASLPVVDQLGFIVFAVVLQFLTLPRPTLQQAVVIIAATLPLHYLVNFIAWLVKLKKNPW